ncbi:hypothetical protein OX284_014535 [Flavobacterium sp. SUN046]|uniref:hypothetical protein n=1 Tax=Flavobacterium sp. SUN046 TaxID=3002440 RepID=UPI002DB6A2C9|nr:hypothetical protein [Flavobacterium sp. SUN046]MEC4050653.1 hypothetical protein [Flavobacterium sp. SUN046]
MTKQRATAIEKEKRLFTIQGWILEGVPDRLIVKQITQLWSLDVRQAQRYIKEAYIKWSKIEGVSIEMKKEMKIAELKQLKRSLDAKYKGSPEGIRAIILVEKEIIKLEGLEQPKRIDHTTKGEKINYTPIFGQLDPIFKNDKTNDSI